MRTYRLTKVGGESFELLADALQVQPYGWFLFFKESRNTQTNGPDYKLVAGFPAALFEKVEELDIEEPRIIAPTIMVIPKVGRDS